MTARLVENLSRLAAEGDSIGSLRSSSLDTGPLEEALASLRISFGMTNKTAEVDDFVAAFETEMAALRSVAPQLRV